jgi:uncharacterized protein (TIGR02996 family)
MMPRLSSLFASVCAQPDDDTPRHVLADALMDLGDLRGEFITLQLACARGQATAAARERVLELERCLGRLWALPLSAHRVEFRRGFPWLVEADEAIDAPTWGTVAVLVLGRFPNLDAFLTSATALTNLERVSNVTAQTLQACAQWRTPKLRALDLTGECNDAVLDVLRDLPGLQELACAVPLAFAEHAWHWSHPVFERLRLVRLRVVWGAAPLAFAALCQQLRERPGLTVRVETFQGVDFEVTSEGVMGVRASSAALLDELRPKLNQTLQANSLLVNFIY